MRALVVFLAGVGVGTTFDRLRVASERRRRIYVDYAGPFRKPQLRRF